MPLRLRNNVHHCICGGRTILLDVDADRYFCLPRASDEVFQRFLRADVEGTDLGALTGPGLLVECETSDRSNCVDPPATPRTELAPEPGSGSGLATIAQTMLARLASAHALRRNGFGRLCRDIAAKRAMSGFDASSVLGPAALEIADAFARTDLIFGRTDRCLSRSMAFVAVCNWRRLYPSLVIGVRTNPFTAHSWVQHGDRVLNDTVDNVRIFSPILVL